MGLYQPGNSFGIGRRQAQTRTELFGDFGTKFGMVAATSLGNVMKQDGNIKYPARNHLAHDPGGDRCIFGQFTTFDLIENADRADGVLVHGIGVVHVILHLGNHTPEIGDKPAKNTGFVHFAKRDIRAVALGQDFKKDLVGDRIILQFVINKFQALRHPAQGFGVNADTVLMRNQKQAQDLDRVFFEDIKVFDRQAIIAQLEPVDFLGAEKLAREPDQRAALMAFFKGGTEDPCQVPDMFDHQVVMFHEAFDTRRPGMIGIAKARCDFALHVKGQAVFLAI